MYCLGIPGLGMLLFWGVLILLLVWLIRGISTGGSERIDSSARETLDQRYARGEIGPEEYRVKKQSL